MRVSRRFLKALISFSLALFFACISVIRIPQAAFGFIASSLTTKNNQKPELVLANSLQDLAAQFEQKFTCFKTETIPLADYNADPNKIKQIVLRLAKDNEFRSCINQNGITVVNPNTLVS